MKVRGTASNIAEKYQQLAREAHTSGDLVAAERHYQQYAEHYYRLVAEQEADPAINNQMSPKHPPVRDDAPRRRLSIARPGPIQLRFARGKSCIEASPESNYARKLRPI